MNGNEQRNLMMLNQAKDLHTRCPLRVFALMRWTSTTLLFHDIGLMDKQVKKKGLMHAEVQLLSLVLPVRQDMPNGYSKLASGTTFTLGLLVMTRKNVDDPSEPLRIVFNVATSVWMPVSWQRLFDFLRDE
ncbi:Homeobox-leucine zipper protein ROC2 [Glycine soja]